MYLIRLPVCVIDCWSSFTDDHLAVLVAGDCFIDTVILGRCSSLVRFLERRTPLPVEGGTSRVSVGGVKAGIAVWQLKTYPDPGSNALADFCRTSSEEGKPCSREIQPIWSKSRCVGLRSGAGRGRLLRRFRGTRERLSDRRGVAPVVGKCYSAGGLLTTTQVVGNKASVSV